MSAAVEDLSCEPAIHLGAKFLDRFTDRFELVQLQPPVLRGYGLDVELRPDSMDTLIAMMREGRLILLRER